MEIFSVICPHCQKDFYADMVLYSLKVELHCPYCGAYFYKEESPQLVTGSDKVSTVVMAAGQLSGEMFYKPETEQ